MNFKSTVFTIVFGAFAAVPAAHASQSGIAQTQERTLTRAEVRADLAAWRAAGLEQEHAGEHTPDTFSATYRAKRAHYQQLLSQNGSQAAIAQTPERTLTRAEVRADLAAWRAAGLEQEHAGEHTPDTFSATYRAKRAHYQQLLAQNGLQTSITQTPDSTLTRAQVRADLAAWRAAGLEQEYAAEHTPDTFSAAYRAKRAHYQQLRAQSNAQADIAQTPEGTQAQAQTRTDTAA